MSLDYADLYFENGFLYILERNAYQVLKYDLKKKEVIDQYSFLKLKDIKMNELYDTGKPFGLAEGLAFTKDTIYIALDNNKSLFSKKIKNKNKNLSDESTIITFKRPQGF